MLSAPQVSRHAIGFRSEAYTSQPILAASNGMEPPPQNGSPTRGRWPKRRAPSSSTRADRDRARVPRCVLTSSQTSSSAESGSSSGRRQWRRRSSRPIARNASTSTASRTPRAIPRVQATPLFVYDIARDQLASGMSATTRAAILPSNGLRRFSNPSSSISISLRKIARSLSELSLAGMSRPRMKGGLGACGGRGQQDPPSWRAA